MARLTKYGKPVGVVMKDSYASYVLVLAASLVSIVFNASGVIVASTSPGRVACVIGAVSSITVAVLVVWWRYRSLEDT
jgi:hypothetical protein